MTNDERIEEYIRAVVAGAPRFTPEQIRRLRRVFAAEPRPDTANSSWERRAA